MLLAALATGSLAVLSSAIGLLLDIFMSSATISLFARQNCPRQQTPFGHGNPETLATKPQAVMIALSGLWILYESVQRLIHGTEFARLEEGMAVLLISLQISWRIARFLKNYRQGD
ncbi:MAG: cation transporter [Syntrophotaleaceae bacterium]